MTERRRRWFTAGGAIALVILGVAATVAACGRAQSAQGTALSHAATPSPTSFCVAGFLYEYQHGVPVWSGYPCSGYGSSPPPGYSPQPYGSPYSPYGYSYGYNGQIGYGYGPPQAGSVSDLPGQTGCGQAPHGYDTYGPCGFGAYHWCLFDGSPECNQQLANGTRCGYGYPDCVALQLTCRLPVSSGSSGGFISFPNGDYTADPASNNPGVVGPWQGLTYDWTGSKWLPVPPSWVAPDQLHYAYLDDKGGIHNVDVSSGADQAVGGAGPWQVLGYQADGIYAVKPPGGSGLWRLSPSGGSAVEVIATGYWQFVGAGFGYGQPASNYPGGTANQLIRVDLKTGSVENWFSRPGYLSSVIGVDSTGHALINAVQNGGYGYNQELWLSTGANAALKLLQGNLAFNGGPVSDRYGLWLSVGNPDQGTYLMTMIPDSSGALHPVLDRVSQVSGALAGSCR